MRPVLGTHSHGSKHKHTRTHASTSARTHTNSSLPLASYMNGQDVFKRWRIALCLLLSLSLSLSLFLFYLNINRRKGELLLLFKEKFCLSNITPFPPPHDLLLILYVILFDFTRGGYEILSDSPICFTCCAVDGNVEGGMGLGVLPNAFLSLKRLESLPPLPHNPQWFALWCKLESDTTFSSVQERIYFSSFKPFQFTIDSERVNISNYSKFIQNKVSIYHC